MDGGSVERLDRGATMTTAGSKLFWPRGAMTSRCAIGLIALELVVAACSGGANGGAATATGGAGGAGATGAGTGGAEAGSGGARADAGNSDGAAVEIAPMAGADADAAPTDGESGADLPLAPCARGNGIEMIGAASLRDRATCLVWQRAASAILMTNKQAAKYCDGLTQDGFTDWRVPAPEELATWPNLAANGNAYITHPIYIPNAGTVADGCTGNSHSCNLSEYNPGSLACAWQGVAFMGPTVCVRGTADAGTTAAQFAAAACDACKAHVAGAAADFHVADCSAYGP
jgi:Protein of unknown function (DUF1566)